MEVEPAVFECLNYDLSDHIATLTLNRPARRNALNDQAYGEVEAAFNRAAADSVVRCVIVTGADPAFCSGEDVREAMVQSTPRPTGPGNYQATPAALAALSCDKPVIAAVNGAAMGWGMELSLFADVRIASEKATFAELFIKRGLVCDLGGFYRLPAIVGPAKAAELLFTGDVIDAAEAAKIGLVSEVVPHSELMNRARTLAARIAANPPLAVCRMKQGLRRTAYGDPREIGAWAIEAIRTLAKTADHREGVASFLEKRQPVFEGR